MAPIIRQPTGGGGGLEPADIGVTVQGYDSDLAAIAALSTTGLANRTGAGTWTTDSTTYLSTSAAASTYQPLDSDLTDIAALTTTANGRSLLTASALTAAGLGLTNGAAIDSVGASPLTATTAASTYMPLAGGAFSGAVTSTSSISSRQSANTVQFLVTSGTAQTINWNSGGNINLDLSSATGNVTLTLQNPVSGATYRMRVQQGATVRNLIFPASTVQQGGGGTTYTGISGVDFLTVYYNGSAYLVQSALNSGFIQPTANAAFTGVTQLAALRLNTYAVIVSTTAPTTRTDGSALVAGDLWFKPTDNGVAGTKGWWIRDPGNLYWITEKTFANQTGTNPTVATVNAALVDGGIFSSSTTVDLQGFPFGFNGSMWIDSLTTWIGAGGVTSTNFSVSNSFELWPSLMQSSETDGFAVTVNADEIIHTNGGYKLAEFPVNSVINVSLASNAVRPTIFTRGVVGTPTFTGTGNISIAFSVNMRGIHP